MFTGASRTLIHLKNVFSILTFLLRFSLNKKRIGTPAKKLEYESNKDFKSCLKKFRDAISQTLNVEILY